jgi:hypothetical protein
LVGKKIQENKTNKKEKKEAKPRLAVGRKIHFVVRFHLNYFWYYMLACLFHIKGYTELRLTTFYTTCEFDINQLNGKLTS